MKALSIRRWMLVGVLIFVAVAALFYHLTDLIDQRFLPPSASQSGRQATALQALLNDVTTHPAVWNDAAWQASLRPVLAAAGAGIILRDAAGNQIFRGGRVVVSQRPSRQAVVIDNGQVRGTVALYQTPVADQLAPAAALLAVVLALLFVRWQMGRYVVRPLEAMRLAARRIAGGELDFALPESRVKEVAEVGAAFEAMGRGLRAALRRQADLEAERRFFIGAIAHDLRTPLFTLRGSLIGLEQGLATTPEKAARYVAVCRQKADQLDRLVADLFAYTKVEYLEQTLRPEPVDLDALLVGVVESLRTRAQTRGVEIVLSNDRQGVVIEADAELLQRAVGNLLDNAIRYSPAEGVIEVCRQLERDHYTFSIADNGPGIAAHDLPHLFAPLYRAEASRNPNTGGMGLGLSIARRILRAHGGDLTAANGAAGGAVFTGWLPIRAVAASESSRVNTPDGR